ncbi:hypothetical protein H1R20_g9272, partial [Candolleomyces eurysporus]
MASQSSELVWLITGTSTGLGKSLALAALARGDKVIATARGRSFAKLEDLKQNGAAVLELDVTSPLETLQEAAKVAVAIYGRIDVLVNNAGYILVGTVEEATPKETLDQFNTNVFGALNVSRAFLPYMREKKTGKIIWTGSIGGWMGSPYCGLYCATKWTLRGISRSLDKEITPLGLRSICVDFGYFRTSFLNADQRSPPVSKIADYREISQAIESSLQAYNGNQPGDPEKGVQILLDIAHGTGAFSNNDLPESLALGSDAYDLITASIRDDASNIEKWKDVTQSTDFDA